MFRFPLVLVALVFLTASALAGSDNTIDDGRLSPNYMPPLGVVPNADVAIGVARPILAQVYGADNIRRKEPLTAQRHGDTWLVRGTMLCRPCEGGVAEIEIDAKDGRVLGMIHGR
jgi:hypothetical protein